MFSMNIQQVFWMDVAAETYNSQYSLFPSPEQQLAMRNGL